MSRQNATEGVPYNSDPPRADYFCGASDLATFTNSTNSAR
jgi:phage terminase large subunit-like protein